MKDMIKKHINDFYDYNTPILSSDIRKAFPHIKDGTIRQVLRRLKLEEFIKQTGPGTFFKPKEVGILKRFYLSTEEIVRKKYLIDEKSNIIGYETGFNFANQISLSTQTSHITEIVSNMVSNKRRKIIIGSRIIVIEAPKVKVNNKNYRLLQMLDLLSSFEKYSEIDLMNAKPRIIAYLKNINMTNEELHETVSKYPLKTQLKFYKLGEINEITHIYK